MHTPFHSGKERLRKSGGGTEGSHSPYVQCSLYCGPHAPRVFCVRTPTATSYILHHEAYPNIVSIT